MKNLNGEPMISGYTSQARKVLAKLRRDVGKAGFLLGKFHQVFGLETQLGPEWVATVSRVPESVVIVHRAYGLMAIADAKKQAHWWYATPSPGDKGGGFAVNFAGSAEFL